MTNTIDKLNELGQSFRDAWKSEDEQLNKLVEECPHDTKLAVTKWVMRHIADHAREGGSYRYLIYDRLGFGPEAYRPLLDDGMFISNEFEYSKNGYDGDD